MIKFNRYKDGKSYAVTFSYDDGCAADRQLVPIFNKYGIKGTFNLFSKNVKSQSQNISADEVKTLYAGHEVACHAYTHPHLELMTIKEQYDELITDREFLESCCGYIIRGMAFPFGTYSTDTLTAMKVAGLCYGRSTLSTNNFVVPGDFPVWNPTCHHNECESHVAQLIHNVEKCPWRAGGVLYIWGHSYELANDNWWDKMDAVCAQLAEKSGDLWFATNIEIYDYLAARKLLRTSADGKTIYNPTDTDIWVSCDDEPLKISACQTVKI